MGQWNGSSTMVRAPYRDNGRMADVVWFPSVPAEVPSRFLASARAVAPEVLGDLVDPRYTESHPGVWTDVPAQQGVVLTVDAVGRELPGWHLQARLHGGCLTSAGGTRCTSTWSPR